MPSPALLALLLLFLLALGGTSGCFTSIFSFGDSIADTGNLLISKRGKIYAARSPYGRTYFHRPTGRYSDGRLIIDFIAETMGLPFIRPFLAGPSVGGFVGGVNFAVAGAAALDFDLLSELGIVNKQTNLSLQVQLGWFKKFLPSICSTDSECRNLLGSSLFLAGEIGGNDYNNALFEGKSLSDLKSYVPIVINAISMLINDVIKLGAKTLLVPGNFPIGCVPLYLTTFQGSSPKDYNVTTGCINWLNEFSQYHNKHLQLELGRLRAIHQHVTIIYGDYYSPIMNLISHHNNTSTGRVPLVACCGGGGPYNVNIDVHCGDKSAKVCNDPSSYVFWDRVHFTEATYKAIARGLLEGPYANPPLKEVCLHRHMYSNHQARKVDACVRCSFKAKHHGNN